MMESEDIGETEKNFWTETITMEQNSEFRESSKTTTYGKIYNEHIETINNHWYLQY